MIIVITVIIIIVIFFWHLTKSKMDSKISFQLKSYILTIKIKLRSIPPTFTYFFSQLLVGQSEI